MWLMVVKKIYVTCAVFLLDRVGAPLAPEKYRPVNAYPVCIPGLHSHVWFPGSSGQGLLIVEAAKFIVRVFPVYVKRRISLIFPLPWRSQGSPSKLFGKQKLSKAQGAFHRVSLESDPQAGSLGTFTTQHPVGRVSGQELAYVISIYLTTGKKTPTRSFPVWSCNVILYYFSFCWTTLLA